MVTTSVTWFSGRRLSLYIVTQSALLLLITLLQGKQVVGSLLEETIRKWSEYKANCTNTVKPIQRTGIYCNGTFDNFACWPTSPPGNVSVPCPPYLPWIKEGITGNLYRVCTERGTWLTTGNSSEIWRDLSECATDNHHFKPQEEKKYLNSILRYVYTIGYSLSLSSLSLAVLILLFLRKLHCTRNYIHMNLFASFIFRAVVVLVKDIVTNEIYSKKPQEETGWIDYLNSKISTTCRATHVFMHYFVSANVFWLLVEGIFLHTLLVTAVLSEKRLLKKYVFIGWGMPILFVVPWTVTKALYDNEGCWGTNTNRKIWWIIKGPIICSITVNLYIFIKILKLLLSKLKAEKMRFNDYKYRLARATLVLIPLLGIHEFVFVFVTEYIDERSRYILHFINLTISSFQGFVVALLYCFANGEVQAELKKRWRLFVFRNHFQYTDCIPGKHFKYIGNCSKRRPTLFGDQSEVYGDGKRPSNVQLLQPQYSLYFSSANCFFPDSSPNPTHG
ncbi:glucagon-like peptide 2 receptor isoform X2 [Amia ocellicauda]|uniref:glucagon-like peptide 2 receptor isoform X2 n=1 Tax=Amia ocellicauda TaxID=2972642 RepID=UPI003464043B